jgi:mannose/fructose-specific phosphotransferase system component IIA
MADTIGMIVGEVSNLSTFVFERDDMDPISNQVRRELDSFDPADEVIICTDMVGSSVNNDMVGLLGDYPNVTLISGMNLPLVITLAMDEGPSTDEELADIIELAAEGIKNCSLALREQAEEDEEDDL